MSLIYSLHNHRTIVASRPTHQRHHCSASSQYDTIYDVIRYIYVRSKADDIANLV